MQKSERLEPSTLILVKLDTPRAKGDFKAQILNHVNGEIYVVRFDDSSLNFPCDVCGNCHTLDLQTGCDTLGYRVLDDTGAILSGWINASVDIA